MDKWVAQPELDEWLRRQNNQATIQSSRFRAEWKRLLSQKITDRCDHGCGRTLSDKTKGMILEAKGEGTDYGSRTLLYCGSCRQTYRKQFGNVGWSE